MCQHHYILVSLSKASLKARFTYESLLDMSLDNAEKANYYEEKTITEFFTRLNRAGQGGISYEN